ncbi:MAG: hypothetical protein NVS2B7_37170 [Herpetosiphon sp.]
MHTNVYTTEMNAKARYAADLTRSEHKRLVRQAKAGRMLDRSARPNRSTARWLERVLAGIKRVGAGRRGSAGTPLG